MLMATIPDYDIDKEEKALAGEASGAPDELQNFFKF